MAITEAQVAKLYVLALGRPADASGAKYWLEMANTNNWTEQQLIGAAIESDAAKKEWGDAANSNEGFVNYVYNNILGRQPDEEGKKYWLEILEKNGGDKAQTILHMYNSAIADPKGDQGAKDKAVFEAKVKLAGETAKKGVEFENKDFQKLNDIFKSIKADDKVNNIEEKSKAFDEALANIGKTQPEKPAGINLTENDDNLVGTDGDDVFNGVLYKGNGLYKSTLNPFDKVDGKEGNDTLNLKVLGNNFANNSQKIIKDELNELTREFTNFENLNVKTEVDTDGNNDNGLNLKGFKNVNFDSAKSVNILNTDAIENLSIKSVGQTQLLGDGQTNNVLAKNIDIKSIGGVTIKEAKQAENINIEAKGSLDIKSTSKTLANVAVTMDFRDTTPVNSKVDVENAKKVSVDLNNNKANLETLKVTNTTDLTLKNLQTSDNGVIAKKATKLYIENVKFGQNNDKKIEVEQKDIDVTFNGTIALKGGTEKLALHSLESKEPNIAKFDDLTALKEATLDGKGNAELDLSNAAKLEKFDASKFEGNSEVKIDETKIKDVVLGSGDDTLIFKGKIEAKYKFDGGDGFDMIGISSEKIGETHNLTGLKNFEGVKVTGATAVNGDLDLTNFGEFNKKVTFDTGPTALTKANVKNLANNGTVEFNSDVTTSDITIKDAEKNANDVLNIVAVHKVGSITANNIETINIEAKKPDANILKELEKQYKDQAENVEDTALLAASGDGSIADLQKAALKSIATNLATITNNATQDINGQAGVNGSIDLAKTNAGTFAGTLETLIKKLEKKYEGVKEIQKDIADLKEFVNKFKADAVKAQNLNSAEQQVKDLVKAFIACRDKLNNDAQAIVNKNVEALKDAITNDDFKKADELIKAIEKKYADDTGITANTNDKPLDKFKSEYNSKTNDLKEVENNMKVGEFKLSADKATTLNVKGDSDFSLDASSAKTTELKTLDATEFKGKLTFDSKGFTKLSTIKGGDGDDTITFGAYANKEENVWGGKGNDTFIIRPFDWKKTDEKDSKFISTIQDFQKGDKLHMGNHESGNNKAFALKKIVKVDADLNLDLVKNIDKALAKHDATNESKVSYFHWKDKNDNKDYTYVISSDDKNGGSEAAKPALSNDPDDGKASIVKLAGKLDFNDTTDAEGNLTLA